MGTWFDKRRGETSGRIIPATFEPASGSYVFVLGSEDLGEEAEVAAGDFTEVRQIIDLKNYDLVGATLDTKGTLMTQAELPSRWTDDAGEIFKFYFDEWNISDAVPNFVSGGWPLIKGARNVALAEEDFTYLGGASRAINDGMVVPTGMEGLNNPDMWLGALSAGWTFQVLMRIRGDENSDSQDREMRIFKAITPTVQDGGSIELHGVWGGSVNQYYWVVKQLVGGSTYTSPLSGTVIDCGSGYSAEWQLWTLVHDPGLSEFRIYIDNNPTPWLIAPDSGIWGAPNTATTVEVAEWNPLTSGLIPLDWDAMRMLNRPLTPSEIIASYDELKTPSEIINYVWLMQIIVNSKVYAERAIPADEARRWIDFRAPVRLLTGPSEVAFRLSLEEAP